MRTATLVSAFCLLTSALSLPHPALAGEPDLVTDQEIAELKQIAEQARTGTLPEMLPRQEIERLRQALKVNPRTKEEAKLAEYRRKAMLEHDYTVSCGDAAARKLREGNFAARDVREIQAAIRTHAVGLTESRKLLDVAEGRVTRASAEAEIAGGKKLIADLEAKLAAVPKESETALNPERYRQEQTAKITAEIDKAREKLTAAEAKLAAVDEVLGKPAAEF